MRHRNVNPPPPPPSYYVDTPRPSPRTNRTRRVLQVNRARNLWDRAVAILPRVDQACAPPVAAAPCR